VLKVAIAGSQRSAGGMIGPEKKTTSAPVVRLAGQQVVARHDFGCTRNKDCEWILYRA
jgi:hypothetical protein